MSEHRCIECVKFGTEDCTSECNDRTDEACDDFKGDDDE